MLPNKWPEGIGKRKDEMEIRDRKQLLGLIFEPGFIGLGLAARAKPVPARMHHVVDMPAGNAAVSMAAERTRFALAYRTQRTMVRRQHRIAISRDVRITMTQNNILHRRHGSYSFFVSFLIASESAVSSTSVRCR